MHRILPNIDQIIKPNAERTTRSYTSEVVNIIEQGNNKSHTAVGIEFDFTFYGEDQEGLLNYRIEVQKRVLLNEKLSAIHDIDKSQRIALKVATINDVLEIKLDKSFKLNKVVNTNEIRQKWKEVKVDLLEEFPDLIQMTTDFDWQLQEEHIQQIFFQDNFYQFFFFNIFYQEFIDKQLPNQPKVIANALGSINMPITEQKRVYKQDLFFKKVEIVSEATINSKDETFPLEKLNSFLGKLPTKLGSKHILDFEYKGIYKVKPEMGLVTQGKLAYFFEVKGLYKKSTTITFNLENHE